MVHLEAVEKDCRTWQLNEKDAVDKVTIRGRIFGDSPDF